MVKPIMKDVFFLGQKSELATKADLQVGKDLQDTLQANRAGCVGMAANMIGVKKRAIIVNMGFVDVVMFNPVLLSKDTPYETEEGCLSLTGVRKKTHKISGYCFVMIGLINGISALVHFSYTYLVLMIVLFDFV